MIHEDSLKEKWITDAAKQHKSDPILVEKVVRALSLLEHLQGSGLKFIFKGGTALMLLLKEPKRFSIDIDVIVSSKPNNMKEVLGAVLKSSDFLEYKINERQSKSNIKKEHYKFYYTPVTNARVEQEYILLDVLYEESHYGKYTNDIEIKSPFIKSEGENVKVTVPIPEAILGDKLTAFAPNTTGVPYGREKEVEIIKQLFDVGHLFDMVEDMAIVSKVFTQFVKTELDYRALKELDKEDVLNDMFQTALLLGTRGKSGLGDYNEIQKGVRNIKNYIFSENFHIERAMVPAAKAAYIATMLQTDTTKVAHFTNPMEIKDWMLEQSFETRLNKLKKSNPEAFFYWYNASLIFDENILVFSNEEIRTLKEAIKYFRAREGRFSGEDPLLNIIDKLDEERLRLNCYSKTDVSLILKVINENIEFMNKYDGYKMLTQEQAIANKQAILMLLFELRKRILKYNS